LGETGASIQAWIVVACLNLKFAVESREACGTETGVERLGVAALCSVHARVRSAGVDGLVADRPFPARGATAEEVLGVQRLLVAGGTILTRLLGAGNDRQLTKQTGEVICALTDKRLWLVTADAGTTIQTRVCIACRH
jgi:hypothetical protein